MDIGLSFYRWPTLWVFLEQMRADPKVRVRICGEIIVDIWQANLQRFAYLFRDLRLLTPFGDEVEICPKTGQWLPITNQR